ncbi:MAG: molybdenum cofactor guanylyltransferase [Pirellulaceae bacterium]|nr:molybdenum cofactor guanylyltransferase [Pirellulaceae bacterium]
MTSPIHAYILAGGRSSRFGSDKARAMLDGIPLIVRLANALAANNCQVTVVAKQDGAYQDLALRTIADREIDRGPMAGLLRALEDLSESIDRHCGDWVLMNSCDLRQWEPSWLDALLSAKTSDALAIAFKAERWQPFPGLYHTALAPVINKRLINGDASLHGLLDDPETRSVATYIDGLPEIQSANTVAEFQGWQEK